VREGTTRRSARLPDPARAKLANTAQPAEPLLPRFYDSPHTCWDPCSHQQWQTSSKRRTPA
jgi:hypothetical protein